MNIYPYSVLAVVVVFVVWCFAAYNSLIRARNFVKNGWADIDVQLKKRYDLIPNLVATVQGYASHEKNVFTAITETRTQAMQATGVADKGAKEEQLGAAIKSLFAVAENYPDLKASQSFLQLQSQLAQIENDIQSARQFYNATVREYNTAIAMVPKNMIAGLFHFMPSDYFQADASERNAVDISTSINPNA
jgi:LemA protein